MDADTYGCMHQYKQALISIQGAIADQRLDPDAGLSISLHLRDEIDAALTPEQIGAAKEHFRQIALQYTERITHETS